MEKVKIIGKITLTEKQEDLYVCTQCKKAQPKHEFAMMSPICHNCEWDNIMDYPLLIDTWDGGQSYEV